MRHREGPVAAIVVAALMGMLMVTWAATIGPSGVLGGDGPSAILGEPDRSDSATSDDPLDDESVRQKAEENDSSAAGDLLVNVLTVLLVGSAVVAVG